APARRGFERAAQKLCITQSAVSQRIKQLENMFGQPLLVRTDLKVNQQASSAAQLKQIIGIIDRAAARRCRIAATSPAPIVSIYRNGPPRNGGNPI
ncbi:LysR family transcriptional regulator, partial [Klebsiella pneumoniae]|uniref:LysR family transcriptional regulator n=1 Tax=Klebsiella pneumoniae TaxID=573 RepID=UPI00210E06DE